MTVEGINIEKFFDDLLKSTGDLEKSVLTSHKESRISNFRGELKQPYYNCCENPSIVEYQGEYICKNCAIVHEPIMKYYFNNNLANNTLHIETKWNYPYQDHGCRTTFSLENLPTNKRFLFWRLAKLNKFFNTSSEANMKLANQFLFKFASQLEIPKTIYRYAMHIYQKVLDLKLTVGRGIKNLMIASLYIACNLNQFSRNIEDFSRVSQISPKTIRKNYRLILEHLNIRLKRLTTSQYIIDFSIKLGLPTQFQQCATQLLELVKSKGINTHCNSKGFAAAIIYFISKRGLRRSSIKQKHLGKISKVSEVTIRKYIKTLSTIINIDDFIAKFRDASANLKEPLEPSNLITCI